VFAAEPYLASAVQPDSTEPADQYGHHHYYVYYWCHGWNYYGCYECVYSAQSAANYLRAQGHAAIVRCQY
jgi:hypothetical protein